MISHHKPHKLENCILIVFGSTDLFWDLHRFLYVQGHFRLKARLCSIIHIVIPLWSKDCGENTHQRKEEHTEDLQSIW